ncbi:ATP-binding cassette domain-containing protein [Candidatus Fermentibacteria bacterium]|nr:ATP-binding cassette domain-containing protein [Candidatus Fermentibacteria bacterium]
MQAVIKTENLHKTYDDDGVPVHAVRGVDLEIHGGEFTALVGPSGSGKTTLLNMMAGLDTPSKGQAFLEDKSIGRMSGRELSDFRRDKIGFIFQAYNLIPVLTTAENVEYVMLLQGVSAEERRKRVEEMLEDVGLEDYIDTLPSKLSGGQQQRVAIARAMAAKPSLVMADEPTANLDSETSGELLDMMRELNRSTGMTFLFSTHDEIVMERATRVVILRDGRIAEDERKA